jgi:HAD superfamily hydrolase (TIGR01549 family)
MPPIKNIIFDLGGVFMNLDFKLTEQAFVELGVTGFNSMSRQDHVIELFEQFETGKITPDQMYQAVRKATGTDLTNEQIKTAWNALLLDFPVERMEWLQKIAKKYKVYLYSNTNILHYEAFMRNFAATGLQDLNKYFIKAYYSHELGLRKPHPTSFQKILEEQGLNPAETLFIDDTAKNIEGAQKAGMQTVHLVHPMTVLDLEL